LVHLESPTLTRHVLVVFLDGVGLGQDNPAINPFAAARMPALSAALGDRPLLVGSASCRAGRHSCRSTLPGMPGDPQPASGQAALYRPQPQEIGGYHG
jgi:hypothetical protein